MARVEVEHGDLVTTVAVVPGADDDEQPMSTVSALTQALIEADLASGTDAILLTSQVDSFGLDEVTTPGRATDREPVRSPRWRLLYTFLEVEKPIVGVIDNAAVDLGLAVTLLCDTAIAAESAVLGCRGLRESGAGPGEAAVLLPLYVGPQRAKEMVLSGQVFSGADAHRLGLVNRAERRADLLEQGRAIAGLYARQPRFAARATKLLINRYVRWMADELADLSMAYDTLARTDNRR
jgi:enoyl-CoA hydratase